jgi:hypothetical protein
MQLMALQLPLLQQVHQPGYAGERERAIGDHRHRGVELEPRIRLCAELVRHVDRRDQRERLDRKNSGAVNAPISDSR